MIMKLLAATIVVVAAFAACGTSSGPAGAECKATSDCDTGLSCLDVAQFNGSACTVVGQACSITCTAGGSACSSLGSNFMCFAGCGSDMTCGAFGP